MNKYTLNAIHDDELLSLIEKLGLKDKLSQGKLKCKFTGTIITFDNLYSIFPESGDIKFVSNNPDAIKLFTEYVNEHKI
jgi:RNA recognition motif-containing protein